MAVFFTCQVYIWSFLKAVYYCCFSGVHSYLMDPTPLVQSTEWGLCNSAVVPTRIVRHLSIMNQILA